jgi:hypothetical protein
MFCYPGHTCCAAPGMTSGEILPAPISLSPEMRSISQVWVMLSPADWPVCTNRVLCLAKPAFWGYQRLQQFYFTQSRPVFSGENNKR